MCTTRIRIHVYNVFVYCRATKDSGAFAVCVICTVVITAATIGIRVFSRCACLSRAHAESLSVTSPATTAKPARDSFTLPLSFSSTPSIYLSVSIVFTLCHLYFRVCVFLSLSLSSSLTMSLSRYPSLKLYVVGRPRLGSFSRKSSWGAPQRGRWLPSHSKGGWGGSLIKDAKLTSFRVVRGERVPEKGDPRSAIGQILTGNAATVSSAVVVTRISVHRVNGIHTRVSVRDERAYWNTGKPRLLGSQTPHWPEVL